jgi:hypothetical protein
MSALPPKADIRRSQRYIRFGPIADIPCAALLSNKSASHFGVSVRANALRSTSKITAVDHPISNTNLVSLQKQITLRSNKAAFVGVALEAQCCAYNKRTLNGYRRVFSAGYGQPRSLSHLRKCRIVRSEIQPALEFRSAGSPRDTQSRLCGDRRQPLRASGGMPADLFIAQPYQLGLLI